MARADMQVAMVGPRLDWAAAQLALRREVDRLASLLRSIRRLDALAVGSWNLVDVAVHLSQVWVAIPGLAAGDLSGLYGVLPDLADRPSPFLVGDLWDLAGTTTTGVASEPERDPAVLADRIESRALEYLHDCSGRSALERRPWLVDGVEVALPTLTYHLLNETMMHGRDIAVAEGRRWPIERPPAAMVFDGLLMPILRALGPTTMVDQARAAGVRATYDIRIRGGGRYRVVLDDGSLQVSAPGDGKVDCHLSMDPTAFLLVFWGRKSQWQAIARGQFIAWGRRPWLGPQLRSFIRNP